MTTKELGRKHSALYVEYGRHADATVARICLKHHRARARAKLTQLKFTHYGNSKGMVYQKAAEELR